MSTDELDPVAIQRDAALLQALSTRTIPPDDVDLDDPVVGHLAVWVDWVDASVDDAPFELANLSHGKDRAHRKDRALGKDRVISLDAHRRRRAAMVAGATIAALVVSSGAAAAVTGDPFLVARAPLQVIEKINPFDNSDDDNPRETLPEPASAKADANKLLADAQRALADGHPHKAKLLVDQAVALLGTEANNGHQHRIDAILHDISTGNGGRGAGNSGQGHAGVGNSGQGHAGVGNSGQGHAGTGNSGQGHASEGTKPGADKQTGPGSGNGSGKPDKTSDPPSTNKGHHQDPKGQSSGKGNGTTEGADKGTGRDSVHQSGPGQGAAHGPKGSGGKSASHTGASDN